METNVNYTIVGTFVIVLVTVIILAIFWMTSGFNFERNTIYALYMQESVSGLSIDSPVEYNGVNVGSVKSISLDKQNMHLVEVLLTVENAAPISQGTVATLATRGVTGITFIALKDKSTNHEPIVKLPGQQYPVIQTAPSLFTRLDTALTKLSTNIEKVSNSVSALLNEDNLKSIQATLANMQKITGNIADNNARFTEILKNTQAASKQFMPVLQRSESAVNSLESQTLPTAYRLLNNLDEVVKTLNAVASDIKQNPSVLIRGSQPLPPGPGEGN